MKSAVNYLLDTGHLLAPRKGVLSDLSIAISPFRYVLAFEHRGLTPLNKLQDHFFRSQPPVENDNENTEIQCEVATQTRELVRIANELRTQPAENWTSKIAPWNELVETSRSIFGDRWSFDLLAVAAAGIKSTAEKWDDASDLYDATVPLCHRSRHARLRSGNAKWWECQLDESKKQTEGQRVFALALYSSWAGKSVIRKTGEQADEIIESLSDDSWKKLRYHALLNHTSGMKLAGLEFGHNPSPKFIAVFSTRIEDRECPKIFADHLQSYDDDDILVLRFCQRAALVNATEDAGSWGDLLPTISRAYEHGATFDRYFGHKLSRAIHEYQIPIEVAKKMIDMADTLPAELVRIAEQVCRSNLIDKIVPVGKVARDQRWFD